MESTGAELLVGYISLFVSCFAFGFMFAPLKRHDAKDGVFVQWVQCAVVFMAGFVINIVRGLPPFNLTATIGGFLYATGNVASVPIVAEMGIGLGMLIWGSIQIIVGWSVARFGLFGTKAQHVQSPLLNYFGVFLTLLSGLMFVFVYSRDEEETIGIGDGGEDGNGGAGRRDSPDLPLNAQQRRPVEERESYGTNVWASNSVEEVVEQRGATKAGLNPKRFPWGPPLYLTKRKLLFIGLSAALGSLHGLMMTPIVYVQDNDPRASNNVLDYVFSHFSAVFFFSTLYFLIYSGLKRGRPFMPPQLVLPSVTYGLLWTLGMTLFIVSNRLLSQTVSFPITVRLPAIIGAVADVVLFKDIQGRRRLIYLFSAIAVGSIGVILVGISI